MTQGALTDLFCKHTSHRDASLSEFYPHKCTPLDIALTFLYGFPLTLHTSKKNFSHPMIRNIKIWRSWGRNTESDGDCLSGQTVSFSPLITLPMCHNLNLLWVQLLLRRRWLEMWAPLKYRYLALVGVALLVEALSHTPKGLRFDPQSGHIQHATNGYFALFLSPSL